MEKGEGEIEAERVRNEEEEDEEEREMGKCILSEIFIRNILPQVHKLSYSLPTELISVL